MSDKPKLCCSPRLKRADMCDRCRAHYRAVDATKFRELRAKTTQRRTTERSGPLNRCCPSTARRSAMCDSCREFWRAYMRDAMRERLDSRKAAGICLDCPAPAMDGYVRCERCNGRRNAYRRQDRRA